MVLFYGKNYENCTSMKLKWPGECDNEVKFKSKHESKLRTEIEFEDKNYKTGYVTLLEIGVQDDFKSELKWFNLLNTKT